MKKGFTLIEILVAVMIIVMLVAMAVPMYEKTIEKSRIAEARTMIKRLHDAKMRLMDDMELSTYASTATSPEFGFENLDFTLRCSMGTTSAGGHVTKCATKDFTYALLPSGTGQNNHVCAARRTGDFANVNFLYGVTNGAPFIKCNNGGVTDGCDAFGYSSQGSSAWCNKNVTESVLGDPPAADEQ